jgi:NAD(P)H-dependent FMN reductase
MPENKLNIQVILGSTRKGRKGDLVANWVTDSLNQRDDMTAELVDLAEYTLPFFDEPMSPMGIKDGEYSSDEAKRWSEKISEADGYVIITPEYNHSYPGVLKNALDYLYYEWNDKPVYVIGYSALPVGGARAAMQLIPVLNRLQMKVLSNSMAIANLTDDMDWSPYEKFLAGSAKQLVTWGALMQELRAGAVK